jgi:methionine aminopeptidase
MSVVTPQVYRFSPGAKTGVAVVDGVKRCMDAAGIHHWEVESYTENVSITLRDKLTAQRRLRLVALTTGAPSPSVACHYSAAGGANETPACWITSGTTTLNLSASTNGIGTDDSYVIETEDSISVLLGKGTDGGTNWTASALVYGVHAGRIFSCHNRSDRFEEGILAGVPNMRSGDTNAVQRMIGSGIFDSTLGTRQSFIGDGVQDWSRLSAASAVSPAGDRFSSTQQNILANVGDTASIERLVPYPVTYASGTTATGHLAYTRFIRARRYGVGDIGPGGATISNTSVFASESAPDDIGWRHNMELSFGTVAKNAIWIWCPPGQETLVD